MFVSRSRLCGRFAPYSIALALAAVVLLSSGCASFYVDSATKEVSASLFQKPATLKPVQVLFEFQTKGTANAKGTDFLKAQVVEQVKTSGLFSTVEETPVADGALLTITINNVPVTDDAFAKGFVTGFTFGLVGSQVTDGYVCTMTYRTTAQPQPKSAAARHAIHTQMGATGAPTNARKAESIDAAVRTMTRDLVSTTLNDLSRVRPTLSDPT
jgi:hypothetical protein